MNGMQFRRAGQGVVDGADGAGERRVEFAGGLHRFHRTHFLAGGQGVAHGGQVHEGQVAQLFLGELGDADDGLIALDAHPFMGVGVEQVGGNGHVCLLERFGLWWGPMGVWNARRGRGGHGPAAVCGAVANGAACPGAGLPLLRRPATAGHAGCAGNAAATPVHR